MGIVPVDVGVNLSSNRVYVANHTDGTVSVIDGATNTVIATVSVGSAGSNVLVGVNPSTDRVYVANTEDGTIAVIDGANITVIATIPGDSRSEGAVLSPCDTASAVIPAGQPRPRSNSTRSADYLCRWTPVQRSAGEVLHRSTTRPITVAAIIESSGAHTASSLTPA